jgi:hypothetical protein
LPKAEALIGERARALAIVARMLGMLTTPERSRNRLPPWPARSVTQARARLLTAAAKKIRTTVSSRELPPKRCRAGRRSEWDLIEPDTAERAEKERRSVARDRCLRPLGERSADSS